MGPTNPNGPWWQYEVGAPISGVMIYDNRANPTVTIPVPDAGYVDVTGTTEMTNPTYGGSYLTQWQGHDRRDLTPSQSLYAVDTNMDMVADTTVFERGLSGFNYVVSNGYTFRRRPSTPDSQTSPMQIKVIDDWGPVPNMAPYYDGYQNTDNMNLEASGDGRRGATIELTFIETSGLGISLTSMNILHSLDLNDYQPNALWGIIADGNTALADPADPTVPGILRAIPFGDTNGSGKATSGDFAALVANYLKPTGMYGGGLHHPIGTAIWTDGDFNVDGVVNHDDYKMFVNPGALVAGAVRNFLDGDVNFDGQVDIFDVNAVSANWAGTTSPSGDANLDAAIDIFDINMISSNWNSMGFGPGGAAEGSGAAAVPEPAGLLLMAVAGAAIACVARRRNRGAM